MAKKKGQAAAFLRGLNFSARVSEVAFLTMVQKAIEEEAYKDDGYENVREFCKEGIGPSYDALQRRISIMKELGPELTGALLESGFRWHDVKMIGYAMTPEQKTKNVISIDGKEIPAEDTEQLKLAAALLKEQRDSARKDARASEKKLAGIDGETKKSEKALLKKIADLEAVAGVPDTPEKVLAGFERINKAFSDLETVIRVFCWKDAKDLILNDLPLQAKVQGIQEQMRSRCEGLIRDWDAEVNNPD